jgi:hypothetical protein
MLQRFHGRDYFFDDYFDLFIKESKYQLTWFQLCYDKYGDQHAITWDIGGDVSHKKIDEDTPSFYAMTPILIPDGYIDTLKLIDLFRKASIGIEPWISRKIIEVLEGIQAGIISFDVD